MTSHERIPKISIVTPSFNQGRFIQTCIDSVVAQRWPDIEHFVIDGGSTDDTLTVLNNNAARLTAFISEPDKGAADAINKGLSRCTGDIVAWLNADDFYLPGAFEHIAAAWRSDPEASFWFGNGVRANEDGSIKSKFNPGRVVYDHRALVEGLDYILQPATFINPKALGVAGPLDAGMRWGFDWDLWLRLAKVTSPMAIDAMLAASREWGSTLTASGGLRRVEELRLMAERYSGKPTTHGALCYWLDTMSNVVRADPEAYGAEVSDALRRLWRAMQESMQRHLDVDASGMPTRARHADDITIGVDLYPLLPARSGGIVPWVHGVLREMARLYPNMHLIMFHRPGESPIRIDLANVECVPLSENPETFYAEMSRQCTASGIDVVIRTYPQEHHPALPLSKQIFVVPDLQHEFFPEFFRPYELGLRRRVFATALARGGAIATMTQHSLSTVLEHSHMRCPDVFLMPSALPEELRVESSIGQLPAPARRFEQYFFMPANLWPHKNHRRLFEAFRRALPDLPPKTGLVLTGNPEGYREVVKDYEDLPIVHLGFVRHEELAALFRNALALVFFSQFEGFGMPLLEAFYHGTAVICSNTTALPEVGGDAILSCDPTDVDAIAALMCKISADGELRETLKANGKRRLAAYDWATPARALRQAIGRVAAADPVTEKGLESPKISIVMPTRNQAKFIKASIDSVLSQDYPDVELIVVDGASTDGTVEILKSYGDRISWRSEPDLGQSDAINKGMRQSLGDILAYLNSDDILLPGTLQKVAKHFHAHSECDMVYGTADYIDENGDVIGTYASADYSFERLMWDCCVCQPAAFWRRRIAERVGPFDVGIQTAMDYDYWLRIGAMGGAIQHIPDRLAQSRLHKDAKTLSRRGEIYREVFDVCRRHGGYVSLNYHDGLWSHRLYDTWPGGAVLQRVAPRIHRVPAMFQFSGQVVRSDSDRHRVARNLFNAIDRRFPAAGTAIRTAWRYSSRLRRAFA